MAEVAAALSLASIGAGIEQGQRQVRQQKRALQAQEEATRTATAASASERRRAELEQRRANRRQPDVASLLGTERSALGRGPAATMLTGASGIDPNRLLLGKKSLLGS
jgi:hypothetical protein